MSKDQSPENAAAPDEVNLDDIEALLEAEDPEFSESMNEVRSVESDQSVDIEASVVDDDDLSSDDSVDSQKPSRLKELRFKIRSLVQQYKNRLRVRSVQLAKDLVVFLKTRPKEFALYAFALSKQLLKMSTKPFVIWSESSWARRLSYISLVVLLAGGSAVFLNNLKGIWLPLFYEPILTSFENVADRQIEIEKGDPGESFYSAFPQDRHEFLFRKFKVNLKRTPENPLPMGAFEVIVELDSKDTAIEIRDREVEFFDLLQRVFEEEEFTELVTESGKARVKARLKRELNQSLTQGWAKEINFKTFVLKP